MKTLIKTRPLWTYTILTYAISWVILLPELLAMNGQFSTIAIAYAMTKLYHWSHGSILIAILYHGIVNYSVGYIQKPHLWQIAHFSPLWLELMIIGLFVITAFVFWGLSTRILRTPTTVKH